MSYDAPNYLIDKVNGKTKMNRLSYKTLIKQKIPNKPKYKIKWSTNHPIEDIEWEIILTQSYNITIDTKLREFQYKYLMNIIPDNSFLHKCHLVQSSLCDFCTMHPDSIYHMFWECHIVQGFWSEVKLFLEDKFSKIINLTFQNISFCNIINIKDEDGPIVNYIVLLSKYFIFKNKCNKSVPLIRQFKEYINYRKKLEHTIAIFKDKVEVCHRKWQKIT